MERQRTEMLRHVAQTQRKVADLFAAEQPLADQAAAFLGALSGLPGETQEERRERGMAITRSLTGYLSQLAELEMALADQMEVILREWKRQEE